MHTIELSGLPQNRTWLHERNFRIRYGTKAYSFVPTEEGLRSTPFFRGLGVFHFDGESWNFLNKEDGLPDNGIRRIFRASDGAVWFIGATGLSRFDPKTRGWTRFTSANGIRPFAPQYFIPNGTEAANGTFWIDVDGKQVLRFRYHEPPIPETDMKPAVEQVSPAGNILIRWSGTTKWNQTSPEDLRYKWRLNGGDWTETEQTDTTFTALDPGAYQFEVYTVSPTMRQDSSPAIHAFVVDVPWWRNLYVIGLFGIFIGITGVQASRIVSSNRKLHEANTAMSSANKELFNLNKDLQQKTEDLDQSNQTLQQKTEDLDRSNRAMSDANKALFQANQTLQRDSTVERIRGEVQAMERASDFDQVLSLLSENLKTVGLSFNTCGIEVLDEPVDTPTMPHFETHGYRYTAYTINPDGIVTRESYHIPAPFPPVSRETIERFIAGEPWQGASSGTAIVEVSIAQYGRLRLTAPQRDAFTDDEIETLQDFAMAISLGYTRYLDFVNLEEANKEIQIQTERKSAFLASMSHELRTPITAMKGFVDNILDGIGGKPNERHERYLTRVTDNASRLLDLVNNLLDLSKVEAGRMDMDVAPFSVKDLITSCCETVEPLVQSNVNLVQEVAEKADEANTDEDKLRHIIGNLLSNAVKFTDRGEIAVRVKKVHDQLVISVSDTGIGMPKESLDTIFDEFQQVEGSEQKQKGTGLGLAITKKYTELLGGTISVASEVGKGTTFTIQIPIAYAEV